MIPKKYKLIISYKGTGFSGWQEQAEQKTVQGDLKLAISKTLASKSFSFFAASRTDKGVHAKRQVALLKLCQEIDINKFLSKVNSIVMPDIFIKEVEEVSKEFNPLNNKSKTYSYYFSDEVFDPLICDLTFFCKKLDIDLMRCGVDLIKGSHSFCNFSTAQYRNSVRVIFSCELICEELLGKKVYVFKITGSGFLKYMVRSLIGTLIELGEGKMSLEDFTNLLKEEKAQRKVSIAPSCGLYLEEIDY